MFTALIAATALLCVVSAVVMVAVTGSIVLPILGAGASIAFAKGV